MTRKDIQTTTWKSNPDLPTYTKDDWDRIVRGIEDFMYEHGFIYSPSISFVGLSHAESLIRELSKIVAFGGVCICDPSKKCPCQDSILQIKEKGRCQCGLLAAPAAGMCGGL